MTLKGILLNRWFLRFAALGVLLVSWAGVQWFLGGKISEARAPREMVFQLPLPKEIQDKLNLYGDIEPQVEKVILSGFFSDWSTNDSAFEMKKTGPGRWTFPTILEPGDNQYKFVVYLKDRPDPFWTHDGNGTLKVQDSFGGWNSVCKIPDYQPWLEGLGVLWAGLGTILVVFILMDGAMSWVLRWRLAFRFKLVIGMSALVLLSNIGFLWYNLESQRETIRQSSVEGVNYLYNVMVSEGVNFGSLDEPDTQERVQYLLDRSFSRMRTRVELNKFSNNQVTLSDVAVLTSKQEMVCLVTRRENASQKNLRAKNAGYDSPEEYFQIGIFPPLFEKYRTASPSSVIFGRYPEPVAALETPQTREALDWLGFNTFLQPIMQGGKAVGFFAGDFQVKLFGTIVSQVFFFNLYLVGVVMILAVLLLLGIGRRVTAHLKVLTDWTQDIIDGDYDVERMISSGDELQVLGENFNKMRLGLKEGFEIIERQNQWLKAEAYLDKMTDLKNRKKLLADLLVPGQRSLVLLNLDAFKEINDFFSNEVGDFILIETGKRLKEKAQPLGHKVYKVGADEFVIMVEEFLERGPLEELAQRYCDLVSQLTYRYQENEIYVALTAGAASTDAQIIPGVSYQPSRLLAQADMALKRAKKSQRRVLCYDSTMEVSREYARNIIWTNKLRSALAEGRIVPFFQPISGNFTEGKEKYECLVRMIEPDGTVISPSMFLRLSQKSRYYRFITKAVVEKSLEAFKDSTAEFSINLSIQDILDEKTTAFLFEKLSEYPQTAKRVVFEIVETDGIENYDAVRTFIQKIRDHGCKVAIDDFGAGYSSFEHILQLKVDYLKIDATLIKNLDHDPSSQVITKAIARFAQELGIETIAEFVHNPDVQEKVKEYGIPYSQGYYIGEPKAKIDE